MAGAEVERHLRIAHRRPEDGGDVLHRVEDRDVVGAVLRRAVQRTVAIHRREAAIAGDEVVQVLLVVHPVAQRDDDVALHALRPLRLGERQLALGDAIGPVAVVGERHLAQSVQLPEHHRAGLTRLHAPLPGVGAGGERAERRRDGARGGLSELMAADAPGVLHRRNPLRLRQACRDAAFAAELIGGGNLEHRVPVDGRIVAGGDRLVGGQQGRDREALAGLGGGLDAVYQTVAACPHLIARRREIRHDEPAAVVGDDALDIAHRQVAGFSNHPHARFRPLRSGHDAADVVGIDRDVRSRLLGVRARKEGERA